MLPVKKLNKGDKVAIVSLSSGVLGEDFVKHEYYIGIKNMREAGLDVVFMPNSLKGMDFIKNNPQARYEDLKQAFLDKDVKAILCAIGGFDGFLLSQYVHADSEFAQIVKDNPKIFCGFSDSTTHHMLLNALGLQTFYGMSFLTDFCELYQGMLPYSQKSFEMLFDGKAGRKIAPSDVWYYERTDYSESQLGVPRKQEQNQGYMLLCGSGKVQGKLYGGCIEIFEREIEFKHNRAWNDCKAETALLDMSYWKDCILLLEVSEEKPTPEKFKQVITAIENEGIFELCAGVLFGKPQDEKYMQEYQNILKQVALKYNKPVLANINVGHAQPHTLLPLGVQVQLDADNKQITIMEDYLF